MLEALSPESACDLLRIDGAVLVDLRTPGEFARGHPKSALSLPFSPKGLADRLGVVVTHDVGIILLAADDATASAAFAQLRTTHFNLLGRLDGGLCAWRTAGLSVESVEEVSVRQAAPENRPSETVVLDVREPMEWETGHVPGALLISLGDLRRQMGEMSGQARIAVICEAGIRSSTAASILQAEGFETVVSVPGGTGAYRNDGLPLQYTEDTSS